MGRKRGRAIRQLRFSGAAGCGKRAAENEVAFVASGVGAVPTASLVRQSLRVGDDCVTALLGCKGRPGRLVCRPR